MIYNGEIFKFRKFDNNKLLEYGFDKKLEYKTAILDGEFEVQIKIIDNYNLDIKIIETASNTNYNLVFVKEAKGEFIGQVKTVLEKLLIDIKEKCTTQNVFKSDYAYKIIDYINIKYKDEPEYLWEKFPNNAIFRDKKTNKWYAAILTMTDKINNNKEIEIIDLKGKPKDIENIIDNKKYHLAYHMNKKHWYTIYLDGSLDITEIYKRIEESRNLIRHLNN